MTVTPPDQTRIMDSQSEPMTPGEAGAGAVAVIAEALVSLAAEWSGTGASGLRRWQQELERVGRMVAGHVATMVAEAERSEAFRDDGHVSVRNWVMAETNCPPREALLVARTARLIESAPVVGDELRAGRIGVGQVREIARAHANPRLGGTIAPDVVTELLDQARTEPYHGFVRLVREWEALVDADGSHQEHEDGHRGRRVSLAMVDTTGHLEGVFGATDTATIKEILDHFTDAEFLAEWDELRARVGDAASPAMLERTDAQRRADALVAVFRRAVAADPDAKEPEPHAHLVMGYEIFVEQFRAMLENRPPDFDAISPRLRMCTLNGIPIDPVDGVVGVLMGMVRRAVIDGKGVIIDMGRKSRCFTGTAREAALLQGLLDSAGRCIWPGCGRQRCEIDHSEAWGSGGLTDLISASLLCGRHNRFKTRGYRTWRDDRGLWHVLRPDGTEIAPAA